MSGCGCLLHTDPCLLFALHTEYFSVLFWMSPGDNIILVTLWFHADFFQSTVEMINKLKKKLINSKWKNQQWKKKVLVIFQMVAKWVCSEWQSDITLGYRKKCDVQLHTRRADI